MAKAKTQIDERFNPGVWKIEEYRPDESGEPYWEEVGNEREIFQRFRKLRRPTRFKGPTGCGKTTFARRMQWEMANDLAEAKYNKLLSKLNPKKQNDYNLLWLTMQKDIEWKQIEFICTHNFLHY